VGPTTSLDVASPFDPSKNDSWPFRLQESLCPSLSRTYDSVVWYGDEKKLPRPCRNRIPILQTVYGRNDHIKPIICDSIQFSSITYDVIFTADHDRGSTGTGRPWQWPVDKMTSWSERYIYLAALVVGSDELTFPVADTSVFLSFPSTTRFF
jgi:hypothetical protein